eukprot:m.227715 g.227715  ORF g.227715 m.227715 type:complete len:362 (+) comp17295_c0_seq1:146-1231(+)
MRGFVPVLVVLCGVLIAPSVAQEPLTFVPVFRPGELGYPCIRIPALMSVNKLLLAYAECRNWTGDGCRPVLDGMERIEEKNSNRDLCMKVSSDGGGTWGPLQVIARDACQPTPVWDVQRQRIVMNFNKVSTMANMQMFSNDFGATWTTPTDITRMLGPKAPYDVGPGIGIQLVHGPHKGRLMFIGHHNAYEYDGVWYSDDGGATYTLSQTLFPKMDEAQLAELPDGTIYANMRNNHLNATCPCRGVARSTDGGVTFSPITFDPTLITPVCQAAVLSVDDKLYFANPASPNQRAHGLVRRSSDGGRTWPGSLRVTDAAYAYSSLSTHPAQGLLGLLWETSMDPVLCSGESCQTVFSVLPANF